MSLLRGLFGGGDAGAITHVNPYEARALEDAIFIDVREASERKGDLGFIEGSVHVPLMKLSIEGPPSDIPKDKPIVMVCRSGGRSMRAAQTAVAAGFTNVHNMSGGMMAWNAYNLPVARR